ncbi:hypothetical protein D3C72_2343890 [compost metagenome]
MLDAEDIGACLDPVRNVAERQSLGGPAPRLVRKHIEEQRALLGRQRDLIDATVTRAADARQALQRRSQLLVLSDTGVPSRQGA